MLYIDTVKSLVIRRQCFQPQADRQAYNGLFRLMSPVQTQYWTRPGNPPELVCRAGFPEYPHVFDLRSRRIIVKGRFQGGNIAYVFADELPLFAAAYSKDRKTLSFEEVELLELLEQEGPMTVAVMKELTGHLAKQLTPVLHRLQQKFLVFEDQVDNEWDRAWYLFETEFPDINLKQFTKTEAIKELVMRFAFLNVFIKPDMLASFYRFKAEDTNRAVAELAEEGKLVNREIGSESGCIRTEDEPLLEETIPPPESVFALHRNDFLVKSHEKTLTSRFTHPEYAVLFYLLIDGVFNGFVAGYFKNGPFVIEDVILDLEKPAAAKRKCDVIEAIGKALDIGSSPVRRYCGEKNL